MLVKIKRKAVLPLRLIACASFLFAVAASCALASRGFYEYAGEWVGERSGEGRFESFVDIAVAPNGNVYVTDGGNDRVQCFTGEGDYIGLRDVASLAWKAYFTGPHSIAIGPDGTVYLIAVTPHKVGCFSSTGSFIRGWKHPIDRRREWWDLVVGSNGDVYVNEIGPATDALLHLAPDGILINKREVFTEGGGPRFTGKVAVAPNGNVFVTDLINDRVYRFSKDVGLLAVWGAPGGEASVRFKRPSAIAVGPGNIVFVEDVWGPDDSSRIRGFSIKGELLGQVPLGDRKDRERPVRITNLAVGPDRTLYAVAPSNHKVFYFRPVQK